ncbi:MAG: HPF/RaiA family ribosome-associated protein [Deltaproteobacteria bacterium]|nr:MAG: HPF/RaiA family ribosome-associated protein [Deltaproteobacteria bacterium]
MKIQFNTNEGERAADARLFAESELTHRLGRFEAQISRVEVHLRDLNAQKGGVDHECKVEVRLKGRDPIFADATAVDGIEAVRSAVGKAQRAVSRALARKGR